jgi:hypothetical protein
LSRRLSALEYTNILVEAISHVTGM